MDKTTSESIESRIQQDAFNATEKMKDEKRGASYCLGYEAGYIAGATAENEKTEQAIEKALHKERNAMQAKMTGMEVGYMKEIKELTDTLEQIANSPNPGNEYEMMSWIDTARTLAETALQQWKGEKEVGDE